MGSQLAVVQPEVNPLTILQSAIDKGASVEQVTALMGLAERWEANVARKAFNEAFSKFKAEAVSITRNVTVTDGPLKGKAYANLFGVVDAVVPALSKHGLSHSWKLTKDERDWMEVTCTIRHELGYSESVSMGAAPDTGPGRNAIQARGSAKSYLERYTLLAATGLSAADEDDNGNGGPKIADDVRDSLLKAVVEAQDDAALKAAYKKGANEATKMRDSDLLTKLQEAGQKRKKELMDA